MISGIPVVYGQFSTISNYLSEPIDKLTLGGAIQIKEAILTGKISSVEGTRMMLDRFDRFHSKLNAGHISCRNLFFYINRKTINAFRVQQLFPATESLR